MALQTFSFEDVKTARYIASLVASIVTVVQAVNVDCCETAWLP